MDNELTELNSLLSSFTSEEEFTELKKLFLDAVKTFFLLLASADKKVRKEEIVFINNTLRTSYSSEKDILDELGKKKTDKKIFAVRPYFFNRLALFMEKDGVKQYEVYAAYAKAVSIFDKWGLSFLSCDNKLSSSEIKTFNTYICDLKKQQKYVLSLIYEDNDYGIDEDDEEEDEEEEETEKEKTLEELLDEMDSLTGLREVKEEVRTMTNLIRIRKIREERGFSNVPMSFHMIFKGNPGTGKTTIARMIGEIYKKLGFLSSGQLVETDRSGLVASYIGQTAEKTKGVLESAKGGILFIDEAYSLTNQKAQGDYGGEAIDTILKYMEDNRDDFIIICAGYPELMDNFLESNPGLKSRFPKVIDFPDYSDEELLKIFVSMTEKNNFIIDEEAKKAVMNVLSKTDKSGFGNARGIRNLFEKALANQANRIVSVEDMDDNTLLTIKAEDICL